MANEEYKMSALTNRPNAALLVIDMQRNVVANAHELDPVVANINVLVDKARAESVPIVWVQHSDSDLPEGSKGWEFVDELVRGADEPLVPKSFGDSFEDTNLEALLAERQVGRIVVTGAQTDACIRSTLHGGLVRGYDVTLVADAHTTEDMRPWGGPLSPEQAIAYTNMYWSFSKSPGRSGNTVPAAEVDFASS
jgi:nicotinamidase-related amidase